MSPTLKALNLWIDSACFQSEKLVVDRHNKQKLLLRVCGKGLCIATILWRWPCVKVLWANDRLSCTSELKITTVCYCAMTFICVSQSDSSTTCLLHKHTVHCRSSRDPRTLDTRVTSEHSVMVHSTHRRSLETMSKHLLPSSFGPMSGVF